MPVFKTPIVLGQDNPLDAVPELTEEEKYALSQRMRALDLLFEREGKAKYKIELMFKHDRTPNTPSAGMLYVLENGRMLHGGGDVSVYFCPGKRRGINNCEAIIPSSSAAYGFHVCGACGNTWPSTEVLQGTRGRHTAQDWAKVLMKYFHLLSGNADIYIKQPLYDIRAAADIEQQKQHKGDKLEQVRAKRRRVIYTLHSIIKDTSRGADLYQLFVGLLRA